MTAWTGGGPAPRIRDSREGPGALLLPLRARSCRLLCGSGVRGQGPQRGWRQRSHGDEGRAEEAAGASPVALGSR